MRIYICGPMTGLPELNFPAFHAAALRWREGGAEVINPAEINPDVTALWSDCMKADIKALLDCDALFLLEGWENSKGANLEKHIAEQVGIEIYYAEKAIAA